MDRAESMRNPAQVTTCPLSVELYGQCSVPTAICDGMYGVLLTSEAFPSLGIQNFYWDWSPGDPEFTNIICDLRTPSINHTVSIKYLALPNVSDKQRQSYQEGYSKGIEVISQD